MLHRCNSTVGFVIVFSSFLLRCVDYGALAARSGLGEQWALDEVLVPRCASTWVLSWSRADGFFVVRG